MKKLKKLFPAALALGLAAILALSIYQYQTAPISWSVEENRALASSPEFSLRAIWDGSYITSLESFFRDHIFSRTKLLKLETLLQIDVLRRPVVRDVVLGDEVLLPATALSGEVMDETLEAQADAIAQTLQGARQAADEVGAQFLYALVPEQRTVYQNHYPDWMENPGARTARNREALLGALEEYEVSYLDLTQTFCEMDDAAPYYSLVDHHYTLKGAYATYLAVCEAFGLTAEELHIKAADTQLLGTYNRKLYGLGRVSERMQVLEEEFPDYERFDNGEPSSLPLIKPQSGAYGLYTDYMGGDIGQTLVTTDRPELPNILIVGDSFTNALEPLMVFSFNQIQSLDYRHFEGASLADYIRDYQPDYVLIVRDDVSCLDTSGNGALQ